MTNKVLLVKNGSFLSSNQEFLLLVLLLQKNWPKNIVVYILANRPLASTWLPLIKTSISGNCSISVENLQYFHNSFPNTTTLFNILFDNHLQILLAFLLFRLSSRSRFLASGNRKPQLKKRQVQYLAICVWWPKS